MIVLLAKTNITMVLLGKADVVGGPCGKKAQVVLFLVTCDSWLTPP